MSNANSLCMPESNRDQILTSHLLFHLLASLIAVSSEKCRRKGN
jgi:hypothetical protein